MRVLFVGLGSIGTRHLKNLYTCCGQRGIPLEVDALRSSARALPPATAALLHRQLIEVAGEEPYDLLFITNPTHLALALQYDREIMEAPLLLAKGEGHLARKIREVAEEHKIPVVQNPPLAQALYREVEVGGEIPEAFYRAVAEVLAFVYRLKGPESRSS